MLFKPEEGTDRLFTSSFETCFTAETPVNIRKPAPQTMQNRTTNNVETHHKTRANRPRNTIQKQEQPQERKKKDTSSLSKNFFCTQRNRLNQKSIVRGVGFEPTNPYGIGS
jgi:hypothetical protein